ncbi:hypothetical protein BKA65DRAFT_506657 [Rhexocercosporidium sp. MPI-PUGE-AT-0058]|nr:hypothetical protein BKA65DRAFT_506657 [Rhexocercosporidium sp. MPI-PUGE-AT-0058]
MPGTNSWNCKLNSVLSLALLLPRSSWFLIGSMDDSWLALKARYDWSELFLGACLPSYPTRYSENIHPWMMGYMQQGPESPPTAQKSNQSRLRDDGSTLESRCLHRSRS